MDADAVVALAGANGAKIAPEAAAEIARVLKPAIARLAETRAHTAFDAEPAGLLKVLRP
jgi:hypothetical protein